MYLRLELVDSSVTLSLGLSVTVLGQHTIGSLPSKPHVSGISPRFMTCDICGQLRAFLHIQPWLLHMSSEHIIDTYVRIELLKLILIFLSYLLFS